MHYLQCIWQQAQSQKDLSGPSWYTFFLTPKELPNGCALGLRAAVNKDFGQGTVTPLNPDIIATIKGYMFLSSSGNRTASQLCLRRTSVDYKQQVRHSQKKAESFGSAQRLVLCAHTGATPSLQLLANLLTFLTNQ